MAIVLQVRIPSSILGPRWRKRIWGDLLDYRSRRAAARQRVSQERIDAMQQRLDALECMLFDHLLQCGKER